MTHVTGAHLWQKRCHRCHLFWHLFCHRYTPVTWDNEHVTILYCDTFKGLLLNCFASHLWHLPPWVRCHMWKSLYYMYLKWIKRILLCKLCFKSLECQVERNKFAYYCIFLSFVSFLWLCSLIASRSLVLPNSAIALATVVHSHHHYKHCQAPFKLKNLLTEINLKVY